MTTKVNLRRSVLQSYRAPDQPIAAVVGASLDSTALKSKVCVFGATFDVNDPLEAIDAVYKLFFALQLPFPKDVTGPWRILQQRVYKDVGEGDVEYPAVTQILKDMENTQKKRTAAE